LKPTQRPVALPPHPLLAEHGLMALVPATKLQQFLAALH
jgi:hypothetical protein